MTDLVGNAFGSLQSTATGLIDKGWGLVDQILPPEKRANITEKLNQLAHDRPGVFSFILSHIALSGLPILIFIAFTIAVAVFALLAAIIIALLGAVLFIVVMAGFALAILFPVLLFTTFVAVSVWLWGWGAYYLLKWFNEGEIPGIHTGFVEGLSKEAKDWWGRDDTKKVEGDQAHKQAPPKLKSEHDGESKSTGHEKTNGDAEHKPIKRHPGHKLPAGSRNAGSDTSNAGSGSGNKEADTTSPSTKSANATGGQTASTATKSATDRTSGAVSSVQSNGAGSTSS